MEGHRGDMKGTEGYGDGGKYLGFVKSPVDLDGEREIYGSRVFSHYTRNCHNFFLYIYLVLFIR